MLISRKGQAPFYELGNGAYETRLEDIEEIGYLDTKFPFYQCKMEMPDLNEILKIVDKIRELKPYYLLHVGGGDICADICGMLVPQITISTVFSKISTSCGEYQIVDKKLDEEDLQLLDVLEVDHQKVKQTMFTFAFKKQENYFTKLELGFREEDFILSVIGWRLDDEVDAAFVEMLCKVLECNANIRVMFIGIFNSYEQWIQKYPILEKRSRSMGPQSDVLALLECCDLYVNPRRNGGGSSVSESLYKGVPAVTLPVGDVSVAAGEEFHVTDYEAMADMILQYSSDELYYAKMQEVARKRAEMLLDSEHSFGKAITEIETEIERNV